MNLKKLQRKINSYEVISFDIFDTLVERCVGMPKTVFLLMERDLCLKYGDEFKDFSVKRIQAEKDALAISEHDEITINEIYDQLNINNKNEILLLEKKLELEITVANDEMVGLYQECIRKGKRVVLCSDMYLDKKTIEAILDKNGYTGYEKLYLSSDKKKRKSNGRLYQELIHDTRTDPKRIIHIGDNLKSDYLQALRQGLTAYYYIKSKKNNKYYEYPYCVLYGDMPKEFHKEYYWKQVGRYSLGNFLFGYINWLIGELERENFSKIFFLSRDGYIMQKAMEILSSKELADKSIYLYASRRSLIVPTLHLYRGYVDKCKIMCWKKHFTIHYFIINFGLNYNDYKQQIQQIVKDDTRIYERSELFLDEELINVYKELEKAIEENSKREYELIVQYLKQNGFQGKVAIIDTGWFGNLQNAIETINRTAKIDADIHGYYIGIRENCIYYDKQKMSGYLYFGRENIQNQIDEMRATAIVEAFHSRDEGSTICYKKSDGIIVPVLAPNDLNRDRCEILDLIQKSALRRIQYLAEIKNISVIGFAPEVYFYGFYRIGIEPTVYDAWALGHFIENSRLHGLGYYLFHLNRLKRDTYELSWKIGQLKRVLKIRMNYMKLYDFLEV